MSLCFESYLKSGSLLKSLYFDFKLQTVSTLCSLSIDLFAIFKLIIFCNEYWICVYIFKYLLSFQNSNGVFYIESFFVFFLNINFLFQFYFLIQMYFFHQNNTLFWTGHSYIFFCFDFISHRKICPVMKQNHVHQNITSLFRGHMPTLAIILSLLLAGTFFTTKPTEKPILFQ